eukprot:7379085-Prymnesium_polylepis.1
MRRQSQVSVHDNDMRHDIDKIPQEAGEVVVVIDSGIRIVASHRESERRRLIQHEHAATETIDVA